MKLKNLKNKLLILTGTVVVSFASFAGEEANIKVKGMVCSFCAQGIKKKFSAEPAVSTIDVNLDDKWVKVGFKDNQTLADDKIKALISDAGYNVVSIERKGQVAAAERTITEVKK